MSALPEGGAQRRHPTKARRVRERDERQDREVERAIRKAERMFVAAMRAYDRALPEVCDAKVRRAAATLERAGGLARKALEVLARPVGLRQGLRRTCDAPELCRLLERSGARHLDDLRLYCAAGVFGEFVRHLPQRNGLARDRRAVRRALDTFARFGRLSRSSRAFARTRDLAAAEQAWWEPIPESAAEDAGTHGREIRPEAPGDKRTEAAVARAKAELAAAKRECDEVVAVLCRPESPAAVEKARGAANRANAAVASVWRLAVQKLGLDASDDDALSYPKQFIDAASWELLQGVQFAKPRPSWAAFFEELEVPSRVGFEYEIVTRPRDELRALARIARLPPNSPLVAAMRQSLEREEGRGAHRVPPRRSRGRR